MRKKSRKKKSSVNLSTDEAKILGAHSEIMKELKSMQDEDEEDLFARSIASGIRKLPMQGQIEVKRGISELLFQAKFRYLQPQTSGHLPPVQSFSSASCSAPHQYGVSGGHHQGSSSSFLDYSMLSSSITGL